MPGLSHIRCVREVSECELCPVSERRPGGVREASGRRPGGVRQRPGGVREASGRRPKRVLDVSETCPKGVRDRIGLAN